MPDINKILKSIESGKYGSTELINLFRNTEKYESITEEERELVLAAIETQFRKDFPRVAKKNFGPADARPREVLEEIYQSIASEHDLSGNTLRNGIKVGGSVISGDAHIDLYISYKNKQKEGAVVHAYQSKPDEDLIYSVFRYSGSAAPTNRTEVIEFVTEDPEISKTYSRMLSEIVYVEL